MKVRNVYFLFASLIWFVSALLSTAVFSKNPQQLVLDAMTRLVTIIAGLYMGLDIVLAPETTLIYKINLYIPWSAKEPGLMRLIGCLWIAGHLLMILDLVRLLFPQAS